MEAPSLPLSALVGAILCCVTCVSAQVLSVDGKAMGSAHAQGSRACTCKRERSQADAQLVCTWPFQKAQWLRAVPSRTDCNSLGTAMRVACVCSMQDWS